MGPRRLRPMIVGVPLEPGVGGMGGEYDIDAEGVDGGGPDPIGDGVVADGVLPPSTVATPPLSRSNQTA